MDGVPRITPVLVFNARPAGRPVAVKLTGLLVAVIVYDNILPTFPKIELGLVMTGGGGMAIEMFKLALPVPTVFVALIVAINNPA